MKKVGRRLFNFHLISPFTSSTASCETYVHYVTYISGVCIEKKKKVGKLTSFSIRSYLCTRWLVYARIRQLISSRFSSSSHENVGNFWAVFAILFHVRKHISIVTYRLYKVRWYIHKLFILIDLMLFVFCRTTVIRN